MTANDRPVTAAPEPMPAAPQPGGREDERTAMFTPEEVNQLRPAWDGIQTRFIDEPRKSVEEADQLVASTVQRLTDSFARARTDLESRWSQGDHVSTEDLRLALRRYRSFFDRLLAL